LNQAAPEAARAHMHALGYAVHNNVHFLNVRALAVQRTAGNLRTCDLDLSAEEHIFRTNFASGHVVSPHLFVALNRIGCAKAQSR